MPLELTGELPRRTSASANGIKLARVAMLLLAFAVASTFWFGISAVGQLQHKAALRRTSLEAVGEITHLGSAGRSAKTRVDYTFTANGTTFTGEARVPDQQLQSLEGASTLPIRYLPSNPAVNHPAAWEESALSYWESFIAPMLPAAFSVMLFVSLRRERRLVAEGTPTLAQITKCRPSRSGFLVNYEFHAHDGTVTQGSGWYERSHEAGANIRVLYLPRNPRRNQPYPSLNYRVAQ